MNLSETIYRDYVKNSRWVNRIHFYKDELMIMTNRLIQLSAGKDHPEFINSVMDLEQQLMVERLHINEIDSRIRRNEKALLTVIRLYPEGSDQLKTEYIEMEGEIIQSFEKNFNKFRTDFNWFCSNWSYLNEE
jgi:hypothetical protein